MKLQKIHQIILEQMEELIAELQAAMNKIKTLSGLLPICAHCKNIRNDKGYWQKIEEYIHITPQPNSPTASVRIAQRNYIQA